MFFNFVFIVVCGCVLKEMLNVFAFLIVFVIVIVFVFVFLIVFVLLIL